MDRVLKGLQKYQKIQWLIVEKANLVEKDETRHAVNLEEENLDLENLEENIKNKFIYFIKIIKVFV